MYVTLPLVSYEWVDCTVRISILSWLCLTRYETILILVRSDQSVHIFQDSFSITGVLNTLLNGREMWAGKDEREGTFPLTFPLSCPHFYQLSNLTYGLRFLEVWFHTFISIHTPALFCDTNPKSLLDTLILTHLLLPHGVAAASEFHLPYHP